MPPRPIATETDPRIVELSRRFAEGRRRLTKQRIKLLRAVLSLKVPATVPEIYELARTETCDYVTAHRSLVAMERIGVLRRVFPGRGGVCFTLATEPESVFMFSAGRKLAAKIELPQSIEIDAAVRRVEDCLRALGYTDISHVIQFCCAPPRERANSTEPRQAMPKAEKSATKIRKPANLTKAERARERVSAFLRQRSAGTP